jgi:hypothetical protein
MKTSNLTDDDDDDNNNNNNNISELVRKYLESSYGQCQSIVTVLP